MSGSKKGKAMDPAGMTKERITLALMGNTKQDKWSKMLAEKTVMEPLTTFCTSKEAKLLIVTWSSSGELVAYNSMPRTKQTSKRKSMVFFKVKPEALNPKNYHQFIFNIEYTSNPLENLSAVSRGVFLPLLKNEENRDQWSKAASQKILFEFNQYISSLYVIVGESQGKTLLPLPPNQVYDTTVYEGERLNILEQFLNGWNKQIKAAILKEPTILFKNNGNPDPLDELRFWTEKSKDLTSIREQLSGVDITKLVETIREAELERSQVLMLEEFDNLNSRLSRKLYSASSNVCFLKSLQKEFESLRDCLEFTSLRDTFGPLMQKLLLVFKHSDCYNTTERLQVLIQQINNSIIVQASKYISGDEIFRCLDDDNADEAIQKIQETICVCQLFRTTFLECKSVAGQLKLDIASEAWNKVSIDKMFRRFDIFLERCRDVQGFTELVHQFGKMERIYIGGTSGKQLTEQIREIYDKFSSSAMKFKEVSYDMMDITAQQFDADFYSFRRCTKELEKRVSIVLCKGFDSLTTMNARFQLLDGFEGLLNRPILKEEFKNKQALLITNFMAELKDLQSQFEANRLNPPIHSNLPLRSGSVSWCRGFKERIVPNMIKLKQIVKYKDIERDDDSKSDEESTATTEQQDADRTRDKIKEIEAIFTGFTRDIEEFEKEQIEQWQDEINETSEENLKKAILKKTEVPKKVDERETEIMMQLDFVFDENAEEDSADITTTESDEKSEDTEDQKVIHLQVNFDPALKKLLREAKYFQKYHVDIPKKASDIHQKSDQYKNQTCQLQLITNKYNLMVSTLSPAELPLLETYINGIDDAMKPGFADINWKSRSVDEFIAAIQQQTNSVFKIYETMKSSVNRIRELLVEFGQTPLCERKNKPVSVDEFADSIDKIQKSRFVVLGTINDQCDKLMKQINGCLTTISVGDPKWKKYVKYVQKNILFELSKVAQTSVDWMIEQIDDQLDMELVKKNENDEKDQTVSSQMELIEVQLALFGDTIKFTNTNKKASQQNDATKHMDVWQKMEVLIMSFFQIGNIMKKMVGKNERDLHFGDDLKRLETLNTRIETFQILLQKNKTECEQYRNQFLDFEHLYKKDRNKQFKEFMYSSVDHDDEEEHQQHQQQEEEDGHPQKVPPLERFEERIQFYKDIQETISQKETPLRIGWLRIDASPLKQALQTWVSKWSHTYTSFLKQNLVSQITNLYTFMEDVSEGLKQEVTRGDLEGLKFVLGLIHQVRVRQAETLAMFEPLIQTVKFLRNNNVEIEDNHVKLLETASLKWESTVDKVYQAKEKVNPLQNEQVEHIKRKVWDFVDVVSKFRQDFRDNAPFTYNGMDHESPNCVASAYQKMVFYHNAITEKEVDAHALNQLENLFELQPSKYRALSDCRSENKFLKTLWDQISLVQHLFKSWRSTLWDDIDTEQLLNEVNKLSKRINQMDKEIRGWKAFQGLQDEVKRYQTVLPLINLLHSETMKDRHWKQMMEVTKTSFVMGKDFSLGNMIDLGVHKFVDDVEEIVEISDKENKIEMQLLKQNELWLVEETAQKFEFGKHVETGVTLIRVPEEVLVNLEESMAILQGIKGQGKYVAHFITEVNRWEQELGVTETVITDWLLVQGKWSSLQSIFVGSADIREQLPEDSKRFDTIDADFKALMKVSQDVPIVLTSCNVKGRSDLLEELKKKLELCEKSLNQYLDTKKMAFPRFYFLSNVALLDLLSNGNNPQKVQAHMGDCFDNIIKLEFKGDTKDAIGMYSKDGGEYVPFHKPFTCEGAVEDWLNGLVEVMRQTLREILAKAKFSADQWELEKPRHEWLYDYCAQIALTASQIIWTEETDSQFEALEDGNETAMKDFYKVCVERLHEQIKLVRKPLNKRDRTKIMTLITVDVHNRDVIQMLIDNKIESAQEFAWQAQMRYDWDPDNLKCSVLVADWVGRYCFEYIGNTGRLVITPLTDRCYITLTQALRLMMGGAPAGPAGTGKTETTKDLGRATGIPVYVFNCSEQMNVMSLGNIFKGLCQTGAWGCFDEFNRIPIEVLSVVATQVGSFLNALRANKTEFDLMGSTIKLVDTVGVFITMNPGYAGRTELPENLKALFRSCAMVVPDMELICENMLMSEGFLDARPLAHKFITLYSLSKELLSQQMHYDWGLRATKAVLRVAGGLKRAEPDVAEGKILMRALRDFNLPKIVSQDQPIFLRLISDLFRGMEIERKVSKKLNDAIIKVTKEAGLQPEDMFVRKVTELSELFEVRHSVFVIGGGGAGKSEVWKMLLKAQNELGDKSVYEAFNPKAIKNDELYGWLSASTGDWYDGVLSTLMRNMSRCDNGYTASQTYKWIVLDSDIDPEWIESLNTVMDDNKVLTLVSNERIPLSASMRLLFEVSHLKNATPATVSRAGILFINDADVGWKPMIDSWIDAQSDEQLRSSLRSLFNKYITSDLLDHLKKNFKYVVPISDIQKLRTLTYLLQGLLSDKGDTLHQEKEALEKHFVYCLIWAFGGSLLVDETTNYKIEFSNWFKHTYQIITYPFDQDVDYGSNTVFDYFYDETTNDIVRWETKINAYSPPLTANADILLLSNIVVETSESVRLLHLVNQLQQHANPALFVGTSGTGKTAVIKSFLKSLSNDAYSTATINLNSYTDATTLRDIMQQHVDKRSGRNFGPPGGKKLIYFIDDLNMPYVDTYGTQSPIALIRQHMDYKLWYDTNESDPNRKKKLIHDCQYIAAMNSKAGSFTVNERLMGHFATFSSSTPTRGQLVTIYRSILDGHLSNFLDDKIVKESLNITNATIDLLETMSKSPKFKPSSTKFHYSFTMRDISNVFQGLVTSKPGTLDPVEFIRLWHHECTRVFGDRLVDQNDVDAFTEVIKELSKKNFADYDQEKLVETPLLFGSFIHKEKAYTPITSYDDLNKSLENFLADYNENNAELPLVLFEMAMNHVVRIARIIANPKGNAFLIGVGGSGKQSLTRLASWICGYEVFQIQVTRLYSSADLMEDIKQLYMKCGVKGQGVTFMLTDSQIVDEKWLVYINDLLSSGDIPSLFAEDEKDSIYSSLRSEFKLHGIEDSDRPAMHEYFINKVGKNLHLVLCFSPVGEAFRVRCRKFPALINCTSLDWFFTWPYDALTAVASRFLGESEELADAMDDETLDKIAHHMAHVHVSVDSMSTKYYQYEKRYNHTTPKSFLELIAFYKKLFKEKSEHLYEQIQRLEKGIATLQKTAKDVSALKEDLVKKLEIVEEKKIAANVLIEKCGKERVKVDAEKAVALEEKAKASVVLDRANGIKAECEETLKKAMPALQAAKGAVDCLTKSSLTELKSLKSPDAKILDVTKAVLLLKDGEKKNHSWKKAQAMMKNVDAFKRELENYNAESIDEGLLKLVRPILEKEYFNKEMMSKISMAAANLCVWVVAIVQYNEIYKDVAPKMAAAKEAEGEYEGAMAILKRVEEQVAAKEALLKKVTDELQSAIEDKNAVERDAQNCQDRLALAERLVSGLSDENTRWSKGVEELQQKQHTLVGDVLLSAAFVSYIGAFNMNFRKELWEKCWLADLVEKEIPTSDAIKSLELLPKDVLTTVSLQAKWGNEGLPVDSISIENAAIVTMCSRWPLLIDPQQQGIKWIRNHHADELKVINLNHPRWLGQMTRAVEQGQTVLIENISENIDPTLDPILSRAIIRKGRSMRIKIAGEEKDYDPKFKLYLQTKLSNPNYKPELFAQCTLINFIVTETGLEEQLLALVVNDEKPELEQTKRQLMRSLNEYAVKLNDLENELLYKLSNAPDDILSDVSLIEGLENTKKTSKEIETKVAQAKEKEIEINNARNEYRMVAQEASWIYFLLIQLNVIDHMYQYSLDAFISFFFKAMRKAAKAEKISDRVLLLRNEIRFVVFTWVSRGLFEKHKLIFSSQLTFKLMQKHALGESVKFDPTYFAFLIFGQRKYGVENPIPWLPDASWSGLCKLSELSGLERFVSDLVASPNRFKEWYLKQAPEATPLPLDWRKLDDSDPFAKLCIVRCMRPDRMTVAIEHFVSKTLPSGNLFTELDAGKSFHEVLTASLEDSNPSTPLFFILSAGADPVQAVYSMASKSGLVESGKYHRVAMGQGQDVIAMKKLEVGHLEGHWVVLENIHLMPRWCKELEKTLDEYDADEKTHDDFRVFLSAEPSKGIPIGILERSIKLTSEPPQGMKANLKRAFASFPKEEFDFRESQVKSIQFALCWFHAVMIERKKFGPKGWNAVYPFNTGDLVNSGTVLVNKLENAASGKIPWADLQYIFGEIMYGGHITDDWDRLLCMTYLRYYMKNELFDELNMIPYQTEEDIKNKDNVFNAPPALAYDEYFAYMDECLPTSESPILYGLHPNTEIAVRTQQSNDLFKSIMELQPKDDSAAASGQNPTQRAAAILEEILDKIDEISFDMDEILGSLSMEDRGPYQYVFLQECERMNALIDEMKRSLRELDLGLHGELTMTERMEALQQSLFFERVPATWSTLAYPSLRQLPSWIQNLIERATQLQEWTDNPTSIPAVVNVAYLFNPQSFLTAVMQVAARKNNLELDKLAIITDVTRKSALDIDEPARDGAYITGMNLEGARWNVAQGILDTAEPREMICPLPVVNCKTVLASKMEKNGIFECPVYQTQQRGPTFVFQAPLRTKQNPDKWVLGGVVIIMDYVD